MFEKLKKIIRNFKPSFESAEQKRDLALGRKRNLDAKRKFQKMNKKQKEDFLSNDFTERLIRVEQRVAGQFGKLTGYKDTTYYKSLPKEKKRSFEKYLENKDFGENLLIISLLLAISLFSIININFTGNAISEIFHNFREINYFIIIFILGLIEILVIFRYKSMLRKKKFEKSAAPIEEIILRKKEARENKKR